MGEREQARSGAQRRTRRASAGRSASPRGRLSFVQHAPPPATAAGGLLTRTFLPAGYPASVTPDYLSFQAWDSCQGLCSYVRGTVSTAALLTAAGVGDAAASPLGATLSFLARDLTGHLCGLLFASVARFDAQAKQWRFAADCANNVGLALQLVAPAAPRAAFLPLICAASVAHAVTGVAGGATRAALTAHFAAAGNSADVAAKEGTQETAVTLLGMLLGYAVVRATSASVALQWAVFLLLTVLHVYANSRAVRALRLTVLNRERLAIQVWHYSGAQQPGRALTPAEVAARESLLPRCFWPFRPAHAPPMPRIRFGVPLSALPRQPDACDAGRRYIVCWGDPHSRRRTALVALRRGATDEDVARAYVEAVTTMMRDGAPQKAPPPGVPPTHEAWPLFVAALQRAGWGAPVRYDLAIEDEGYRFESTMVD